MAVVIRTARRISEGPKVIIEGMVFLHDDNNVINLAHASLAAVVSIGTTDAGDGHYN